jgi:hypothetical protein
MNPMLLAAALALQILPRADAVPSWEVVAEDSDARFSLDPASPRREGDVVRFIGRAVAHRSEADGLRSGIVRYVLDCRARTIGIEVADGYREDGSLLNSRLVAAAEFRSVPVDDFEVYRAYLRRVCGGDGAAAR